MLFKWKKIGLVIFIITLGVIANAYQNKITKSEIADEDGLLLIDTFKKMNIRGEKILLNFSNQIGSNENAEYIHKYETNLEQAFSLDLKLTTDQSQKDIIKYEGFSSTKSTNLQIVWVGVQDDYGKYNSFLVVTFTSGILKEGDYLENYLSLYQSLQALSINPAINVNIQGNINRKVAHDEQLQLINKMFNELEAIKTEGLNEKQVISLTGRSKQLSHSIDSNGTPINVQIASRYDPVTKKTKFTIGTPVITMEY
ncbi:YwmB family TATA-box binding protein [Cytobacillus firmus]|uniref:YwmB family TATA-box binding protein n=1 Tax=Cytobacillus firmus TaxID=1399 RepID=A0AA46SGR7_CYTFI|nr:YwmB family TATA-box binding protein [Cytobacillus firmus]UYG98078.1 YwmB family TATA-box binding protein [Cytobacillus firmus]